MTKISGVCVGEGRSLAKATRLLTLICSLAREEAPSRRPTAMRRPTTDGFTSLLALVAPNLMCKPPTILDNR